MRLVSPSKNSLGKQPNRLAALIRRDRTMAANDSVASFLNGYPRLSSIVDQLNQFLTQNHPETFGDKQTHPCLPAKRSKVIHDHLWGTVRFTWRELALIDLPILQRLRDIHQTGLAYHVYPSARHTRFEHSLGAATVASRVFDSVLHRQRNYLLRDAQNAGLPLRYDLDRYLYDVQVSKEILSDGNGELEKLYDRVGAPALSRKPASPQMPYPYYETYRLRLSRRAMNVIEQIIICKMMLFSYIYHHTKVRASDGLLERLLRRRLQSWQANGDSDEKILDRFLKMTDSTLHVEEGDGYDELGKSYRYRLVNCLLPRAVYSISGPSATHAEGILIQDFLMDLQDRTRREALITDLERAIGEELQKLDNAIGSTPQEATARTGIWVDAPKPPRFEDVDEMIRGARTSAGVPLAQLFPIREWTEAYLHYRYQVRTFAFSEYFDIATMAAKNAMKRILEISSDSFYDGIRRERR